MVDLIIVSKPSIPLWGRQPNDLLIKVFYTHCVGEAIHSFPPSIFSNLKIHMANHGGKSPHKI